MLPMFTHMSTVFSKSNVPASLVYSHLCLWDLSVLLSGLRSHTGIITYTASFSYKIQLCSLTNKVTETPKRKMTRWIPPGWRSQTKIGACGSGLPAWPSLLCFSKVKRGSLSPSVMVWFSGTPGTVASVHGILQAKILEWLATPFSREIFPTRDRNWVSHIAGRFLAN